MRDKILISILIITVTIMISFMAMIAAMVFFGGETHLASTFGIGVAATIPTAAFMLADRSNTEPPCERKKERE